MPAARSRARWGRGVGLTPDPSPLSLRFITPQVGQGNASRAHGGRVGHHIDAGRLARGEGFLQGRADLLGPLHEDPLAAEGLDEFVIVHLADPGSGLDGVAEAELLAVPDHAPSEIVANHDDDGKLLPDGVLEFHEIEAHGSVSDHQADPAVGVEQLRCIGVRQSYA